MIVKLSRAGFCVSFDADSVTAQVTERGAIDLRICKGGVEAYRCLICNTHIEAIDAHPEFDIAYVMENGKTVDTIRAVHQP